MRHGQPRAAWIAASFASILTLASAPGARAQVDAQAFQREIALGHAAARQRRFDVALVHFQQAHALSRGDRLRMGLSAGMIASSLEQLGRLPEALQWYEAAVGWLPPESRSRAVLAAAAARLRSRLSIQPAPQPVQPAPQPVTSAPPAPLAPAPPPPRAEQGGGFPTWAWVAIGSAVAVGVGVGAYFLFAGSGELEIPYDAPDGVVMTLR